MIDTLNFKPLQVLTIKDIAYIIGMSEPTAKLIASDIKKDFNIERITYTHLQRYLKI